MEPILHKDFSYRNVYVKHSSHILLVYLWCLQSALFSLCGNSKQYSRFCWCFLELMLHSWMTGVYSIVSACMATIKSINPLTDDCFWQSRCAVMLFKPFLNLDCVFVHQKAMFNKSMKYFWVHCFHKSKNNISFRLQFIK